MEGRRVICLVIALLLLITLWVFYCSGAAIRSSYGTIVPNGDVGDDGDPFDGRRLRSFKRDGIVIPDRSVDSRECDDFERIQTCHVADGYVACFDCLETRTSLRICTHLTEPLQVHDERTGRTHVLPANVSESEGYCLREQVARDIRHLAAADDDSSPIGRARRVCSVYNADWLLVKRRTIGDSTYNFVCRCKYPHLMTNVGGPLSACARDVACNGHGRLDDDAHASLSDPFVNGRCLCESGWLAEYDASAGIGPYCRQARFSEWPSAFFGGDGQTSSDLPLSHPAVDEKFRSALEFSRLDAPADVWLPNPCDPCPLVRSTDGLTYFCGDLVEVGLVDEVSELTRVHVGIRQDRDYLSGNGGRLPNACLSLLVPWVDRKRILAQYMSQAWNDGTQYAHEWGILVQRNWLGKVVNEKIRNSQSDYRTFIATLQAPRNKAAFSGEWGVVWLYNDQQMLEHRREVNDSIWHLVVSSYFRSDLCYHSNDSWYDFPVYGIRIPRNSYAVLGKGRVKSAGFARQTVYRCPDLRGIDQYEALGESQEINEQTAERLARALLPTCIVSTTRPDGSCYDRPELNANHDNVTACILFDSESSVTQYAYILWYPRTMDMRRFVSKRNVSLRDQTANPKCP